MNLLAWKIEAYFVYFPAEPTIGEKVFFHGGDVMGKIASYKADKDGILTEVLIDPKLNLTPFDYGEVPLTMFRFCNKC